MKLTFGPRGTVQIDDARITFRNFEGRGSAYNREGDRNFSLIVPDKEAYDALTNAGYYVRVKPAKDEDGEPMMNLPIKVKFNARGPKIFVVSGNHQRELTEETCGLLDTISISRVDLDIRPFNYNVNGKVGVSAYLDGIRVVQELSRFAVTEDEEAPF